MAGKVSKASQVPSFEQRLEQLEALADQMEQGELPLQELLKKYEEGILLSNSLTAELEQAKAKMLEMKLGMGEWQRPVPSSVVEQASLLDGMLPQEDALPPGEE